MALMKVTKTGSTRNNKDYCCFDGKETYKDFFYIKQGLGMPRIGDTLEAETHAWTPPGKTDPMWFLDAYKVAGATNGGSAPTTQGNARTPLVDAPAKALAGWAIQDGDLSRYASNIVASAITAGLVKVPQDIAAWAAHAYASGEHLRKGSYLNFSPIDANEFGPDPSTHAGDPGFDEQDLNDRIPF